MNTDNLPFTAEQLVVVFHNVWAKELKLLRGSLEYGWERDHTRVPSYTQTIADFADGVLANMSNEQLFDYLQTWSDGENSPAHATSRFPKGVRYLIAHRHTPETLGAGFATLEAAEQRYWPTGAAKSRLPRLLRRLR